MDANIDIEAKNIYSKSFEDTDRHTVESNFEEWKGKHESDRILHISYNVGMVAEKEGALFRLYNVSLIWTPKKS